MSTIIFAQQGDVYVVRFRYDPGVIELLKAAVPSHARSWDPSLKQWQVRTSHAERLASALRATGHQVIGLDPDPPPRTTTGTDLSQWARILFRRVGPTRHEPVFRVLTKVLHPDNPATGDTTLQRELNLAREQLTEGDH